MQESEETNDTKTNGKAWHYAKYGVDWQNTAVTVLRRGRIAQKVSS
jgi:hypothetical protein